MNKQTTLNNLYFSLLEQLKLSTDGILYLAHEQIKYIAPPVLKSLQQAGLLKDSQPLTTLACVGCEQRCIMPVQHRENSKGKPSAYILCDKRDDISRVDVDFSRLIMHSFTLAGLAALLGKTLPTDRPPQEIEAGSIFHIGIAKIKNKRHDIFLCRTLLDHSAITNANAPVIISLQGVATYRKYPLVSAASLIYFENAEPCIDRNYLQQTIQKHNSNNEIALEIELVNSEIILINHVTSSRTSITKTDFDSNNDNAFEFLFTNAGKRLTERELIAGAEIGNLNLQKFVDQLRFKGNLRKLFFRVSKNAICFNRTATFKQLHALGIDPSNPV